jgi:uncharacterized protein
MYKGNLKILWFVVGTFAINYLLVFGYLALGGKWVIPFSVIIPTVYMLVPAVVAVFVQKFLFKEPTEQLGLSFRLNWWFLAAWLIPVVLSILTLGISLRIPGVEFSPGMQGFLEQFKVTMSPEELKVLEKDITSGPLSHWWVNLLISLVAGITPNAIPALGEELGWRGLMHKELLSHGFWQSSLMIGVTWGIWHLPLVLQGHNYPQHPQLGIFMMIAMTVALSPLFTYVRIKSGSVLAPAVMHGTINAMANFTVLYIKGGSDLLVGFTGVAGLVASTIVMACLILFEKFWARERTVF